MVYCIWYWHFNLFPFFSLPAAATVSTKGSWKKKRTRGHSSVVARVFGPPNRTHSILTSAEGENIARWDVSERDQPVAERFIIRKLWGRRRPLLELKLVIQSSFCNLIIYLYFMHLPPKRRGCMWDRYVTECSVVKWLSPWTALWRLHCAAHENVVFNPLGSVWSPVSRVKFDFAFSIHIHCRWDHEIRLLLPADTGSILIQISLHLFTRENIGGRGDRKPGKI